MSLEDFRPGRWRHYKGNEYELLSVARHSETLEPMVVYRALYGDGGVWVRPAPMWNEPVNGTAVRRFTFCGDMDVTLRLEEPSDHRETENLTRKAFWNLFGPGCDEHYLLHVMREDASYIPQLGWVAEQNGIIIGHIAYTRSHIEAPDGSRIVAATFGPVSVLPEYQKSGVGARLIFHTLDLARTMGYNAVVILGHPGFYPRFGFKPARETVLSLQSGDQPDALMALELTPGGLPSVGGVYRYADVFNVDHEAAALFDGTFPPKEKTAGKIQI